MQKSAQIDPTGLYRYRLTREWNNNRPAVGFVMLNPSTADATQDDPTIRACLAFAQRWNYGSLIVVNLFAYRATSPQVLRRVRDPIGVENDDYIAKMCGAVELVVVAWGNPPTRETIKPLVMCSRTGGGSLGQLGAVVGARSRGLAAATPTP